MRQPELKQPRQSLAKKPTLWSMILVPAGIAAIMTPAFLLAASGTGRGQGFDAIVSTIELRYHAHATRIPFMGLISGIAHISTHGGVRGIHVAEFEHFRQDGDEPIDGAEFNALIEQHVGHDWQRMIRETSREHDGKRAEQTLIYVRPDGEKVSMLIVDLDSNDLDVVQVSVDPDHLLEQMEEHRHHHNRNVHNQDDANPGEKPAADAE